ncbi:hypothetical protein GIB67_004542 [Kingdonia uniflora]|uniref:Uncharacterized protein n=1 Tax=Kingdonia uniflora TaxID=39325 RepID=A0A7J7MLD9_9MAGN|nr:hypothetical protein GIB67_004542 [Kingdonia uniflora]
MILTFGSLANSTPYLGGVLLVIVLAWLASTKSLNSQFTTALHKAEKFEEEIELANSVKVFVADIQLGGNLESGLHEGEEVLIEIQKRSTNGGSFLIPRAVRFMNRIDKVFPPAADGRDMEESGVAVALSKPYFTRFVSPDAGAGMGGVKDNGTMIRTNNGQVKDGRIRETCSPGIIDNSSVEAELGKVHPFTFVRPGKRDAREAKVNQRRVKDEISQRI